MGELNELTMMIDEQCPRTYCDRASDCAELAPLRGIATHCGRCSALIKQCGTVVHIGAFTEPSEA